MKNSSWETQRKWTYFSSPSHQLRQPRFGFGTRFPYLKTKVIISLFDRLDSPLKALTDVSTSGYFMFAYKF